MRVRTHVNPLSYIRRMDKIEYFPASINKFLDFEIGFGAGVFALGYAKKNPERNLIAIEIRKPLVEFVLAENEPLKNLHLIHGKAEICLEDTITDSSLDRIFLFHPDPWLKKRHNKRRVMQPEFLKLIAQKLKLNGVLYVSTDVEDLWNDMTETITAYEQFEITHDEIFWQENYVTEWHKHSKKENRSLFYGVFRKIK